MGKLVDRGPESGGVGQRWMLLGLVEFDEDVEVLPSKGGRERNGRIVLVVRARPKRGKCRCPGRAEAVFDDRDEMGEGGRVGVSGGGTLFEYGGKESVGVLDEREPGGVLGARVDSGVSNVIAWVRDDFEEEANNLDGSHDAEWKPAKEREADC